jgi:hypothetical protein
MTQPQYNPPRRERNLTEADIIAIAEHFQANHVCRLSSVSVEEIGFMKDLLTIYKESRSEIIKWAIRGIVYAFLVVVALLGYFKLRGNL